MSKFNKDDHILVELEFSPRIWVGRIVEIEKSCYLVQSLSSDIKFFIKLPFLFDSMLSKIEPDKVENTIQSIKILFESD